MPPRAAVAEPADGPGARGRVAAIAARHGIAVGLRLPGAGMGDACVQLLAELIGPYATRLANYRKTHLFGDFEQPAHFRPGDTPVVQAERTD